MGNILHSSKAYRNKNHRSKNTCSSISGKRRKDCKESKQLIVIREEVIRSCRMSSKLSFQHNEGGSDLTFASEDRKKIDSIYADGHGGSVEAVTTPIKHPNTSVPCCSNSSPQNSFKNSRDTDISMEATANCSIKVTNQDPQNISTVDHKAIPNPPFSNLWLPFKSPFRRPFFFTGSKAGGTENGLGGGGDIPMALAGSSSVHKGSYIRLECEQQIPWLQPNSLDSQPHESKLMAKGCLDHDDVHFMRTANFSNQIDPVREGYIKNDRCGNSNIGDIIQNSCCGVVPPLFQTVVRIDRSEAKAVEVPLVPNHQPRSLSDVNDNSTKQGAVPIKLSRRGKNDSSSRHQKEQRQQDQMRLNHKKQRGAHQASSSPPSNPSLPQKGSLNKADSRGRDASPPPTLRYINDRRVTIIDEGLKIFVVDLLTPETCELVRRMTDNHVKQVKDSGCNIATWRTLYTYTKRDLPCSEVKGLTSRVTDHIMASIIDIVGKIYGNEQGASKLHPRSWKEPHLLLYQKFENEAPHTGVEMHYDGCDITWNCMLSKSSDYDGGGTYIRALRKTVRLEQGQILVHPGELYHKGCDITGGERALIVCFMDGFDPHIVDPSSAQDDNEIYEKNVRMY